MQMINKGNLLSFFWILVFGLLQNGLLNAQDHGNHTHSTETTVHNAEFAFMLSIGRLHSIEALGRALGFIERARLLHLVAAATGADSSPS